MSETAVFPDCHETDLLQRLATDGSAGVVSFIDAFPEPSQRRQLYSLAQRKLPPTHLDALTAVGRAGIAEALRQAASETEAADAAKRRELANVLSFNLAAALAECWPDNPTPRERHHLEAGLAAAEDCLRWRSELGKGVGRSSIAWWVRGVHELSLGHSADAVRSFGEAREAARRAATAAPAEVAPGGDFSFLLATGYLGLAQLAAGADGGRKAFDSACAAFEAGASGDDEAAEDAKFGLGQLRCYAARLAGRGAISVSGS